MYASSMRIHQIKSIILFAFLFILWEITSQNFDHLKFVLPAPTQIFLRLIEGRHSFLFHTYVSLKAMFGGFCLAFSVAFPLGWSMARYSLAKEILQPFFVIIQCIPMFALAPIMIIWFGWSYTAIVVPTALMIFFPLTMNIYQGLTSTPKHYLDFFKANQATPWQLFYKLQLPWAIPHICSGFKIAAAIAGIAVIAGEWAGAQNGLGMLMLEGRRGGDLETTFAALFCLTIISMGLYRVILTFEAYALLKRKKSIWHKILRPLTGFMILFLMSCQQDHSSSKVRLMLDWLPNPNHIPLYVGIEQEFFKNHGVNLEIIKVHEQGSQLPFVTSGQAELAIFYMPHTMRVIAKGAELELIAPLIQEPLNGIIYRKNDGIQTIYDLQNRVLGNCVDGSKPSILETILQKNEIVPSEKRNVSFDLVSTLGTKSVDAIYGGYWNIEAEHLRSYGVETDYFKLSEFGIPNYYELLFVARKNSPQAQDDFKHHFQEAVAESIAFCQNNPEQAFQIYVKHNPDKSSKTLTWERRSWDLTYPVLAKDKEIDPLMWENFHKWLLENGIIEMAK